MGYFRFPGIGLPWYWDQHCQRDIVQEREKGSEVGQRGTDKSGGYRIWGVRERREGTEKGEFM